MKKEPQPSRWTELLLAEQDDERVRQDCVSLDQLVEQGFDLVDDEDYTWLGSDELSLMVHERYGAYLIEP